MERIMALFVPRVCKISPIFTTMMVCCDTAQGPVSLCFPAIPHSLMGNQQPQDKPFISQAFVELQPGIWGPQSQIWSLLQGAGGNDVTESTCDRGRLRSSGSSQERQLAQVGTGERTAEDLEGPL